MTNDETIRYCARLETGFRTSSAHLKELERDLTVTLQRAREFGKEHGPPDDWKTHWDQQWDNVERILCRISVLVNAMDVSVESSDSDRLEKALEAWDSVQSEGAHLVEALNAIRAQAIGLNAAVRKDWNMLAHTIECHLETVEACARALRIKLELLILVRVQGETNYPGPGADAPDAISIRSQPWQASLQSAHHSGHV